MPSQFFGLNIAYTGLTTANAGINTVANNISNVETDGYSRQEAVQQANSALRTFTTYGCAGAGVDTIAIERIRDDFYDSKFWDNEEKKGEMDVKAYYMKSIENYFTDTDTNAGFNTSFDLMYNALEELSKNSGDTSTKAQFVNYAQSLCDYFNSISTELSEIQKDVNMEIKDTIARINSIAEQLSTLNKQINVIELTGTTANELRDKRTLLIDELSTYVSVSVKETPVYDEANNFETGASRYIVEICGGQLLVDTNDYFTLECTARDLNETLNQSDARGLYDISWVGMDMDFELYNPLIGGKLQGLIELRDGNNLANFNGTVSDINSAEYSVDIKVTDDYLMDLNKCTLSQTGGKINLGAEEYYYTDWTYKYNAETGECIYTFNLDRNYGDNTLSTSRIGKDAKVGVGIDYQGIPYYQEQLNEFVRLFAEKFNEILTQDGAVDGYGNAAQLLFTADNEVEGQYTFSDYLTEKKESEEDPSDIIEITNKQDSYYRLTAQNFCVSDAIIEDPELMATRTGESDGTSKADIVLELIDMRSNKEVLTFRSGTAGEFLQSILSDVALNANRANTSQSYYETMSNTIDNERISISGVDSDEEAVNLMKYQNAYNLASKMISVLSEIYDRLILQTGV